MNKFLIFLIVIFSCKKEVYYYPSKSFFDENKPKEIIIENLSYGEIVDSLTNQIFKGKRHFIEIKDSNKIYKISPFTYTGGYIRERNGLYIRNDSLDLMKGMFPISDLSKYLKLHYENNDKEYYYAFSYKRAYIRLILERDDSSGKLKKILLNLVEVYNKTDIKNKDSIKLGIMLDYLLKPVFPLTPPLSPNEIIEEL
ncbi:hypothetical protein [Polaribacter cellanae]|uniref:Uncharacterized protein n=1 Tax=Polaribacter cellanae TaxID=2818493 RepID=A0A975H649_9FLAO|nr:hypothetical protein [Polaribacter cellanae]QTE22096.1 hypothetical protein J3359_14960 [Polaribacter cellanae]